MEQGDDNSQSECGVWSRRGPPCPRRSWPPPRPPPRWRPRLRPAPDLGHAPRSTFVLGEGRGRALGPVTLSCKKTIDYWYSNCRICFTCCSCSQFSSWQTSAKCIWARAGHCGSSRGWGHSCPGSAPHPGLPTITGSPHLCGISSLYLLDI